MQYTICDRCGGMLGKNKDIKLKDTHKKDNKYVELNITLYVHSMTKTTWNGGSESVPTDICNNCVIDLLDKKVKRRIDNRKDSLIEHIGLEINHLMLRIKKYWWEE